MEGQIVQQRVTVGIEHQRIGWKLALKVCCSSASVHLNVVDSRGHPGVFWGGGRIKVWRTAGRAPRTLTLDVHFLRRFVTADVVMDFGFVFGEEKRNLLEMLLF